MKDSALSDSINSIAIIVIFDYLGVILVVKVKKRTLTPDVESDNNDNGTKQSKFNNKRVLLTAGGSILKPDEVRQLKGLGLIPSNGMIFDSELEAEYYRDILHPRELTGEIKVQLQPKFQLIKEFEKDGVKYRPIHYIPDFLVTYQDGISEAVDVKGFHTETFNLKRKLFDYTYPNIRLLVMKRVRKYGGWITAEQYMERKRQDRTQYRSLVSRTRKGRKRHGAESG